MARGIETILAFVGFFTILVGIRYAWEPVTNLLVRGLREQREFEQEVDRLHEMDDVLMLKWRSRGNLGTSAPLPPFLDELFDAYASKLDADKRREQREAEADARHQERYGHLPKSEPPEWTGPILNFQFPDGTTGDYFEGSETWAEFCERKGKPEFIKLHRSPYELDPPPPKSSNGE